MLLFLPKLDINSVQSRNRLVETHLTPSQTLEVSILGGWQGFVKKIACIQHTSYVEVL